MEFIQVFRLKFTKIFRLKFIKVFRLKFIQVFRLKFTKVFGPKFIEVFRFKFSNIFLENLQSFSVVHRYDKPKIFKENWEIWVKNNQKLINLENESLQKKGYSGDIMEKMYKSARYYFKNKSQEKNNPKKRRVYTRLDEDMLIWMDTHISRNFDKKPNDSYNEFINYENTKRLLRTA